MQRSRVVRSGIDREGRRERQLNSKAFTLVELLVVIGIIALLISILLPVLSSVRKQAAALKCAASLREIGNCFLLYAADNKGYAPVAKAPDPSGASQYRITFNSVPPVDVTGIQFWPAFIAKYAARAKYGLANVNASEASGIMKGILWGCPEWQTYASTSAQTAVDGADVINNGYGMNAFPEYTRTFPTYNPGNANTIGDVIFRNDIAVPGSDDNWATIKIGKWYKLKAWTSPAEKALVGDCLLWVLEAQSGPVPPTPIPGQFSVATAARATWDDPALGHQTTYDFYRHGKYPAQVATNKLSPTGGKVAFNILYADGHVRTVNDRIEGYKAARMRFPG